MRHTSSFFTAASQISAFFCLRLEVCLLARVTASIVFSVYLIVIATFVATSGPEQTFPLERFIFCFALGVFKYASDPPEGARAAFFSVRERVTLSSRRSHLAFVIFFKN
ncbi:hypothetical protein NDU88_005349 [Pleurodeles waltl]|uniref:Secreted protein n=1 Tax=Pleurodeles waltl TaxID=8319 RepID=A0AAV7VLF0_PLEWA|nr:hypothetical protein NDU88_005349 [Pleurodeles waltl]